MKMQRVNAIHTNTTIVCKIAMMVAIATKSRRLALLCELDIYRLSAGTYSYFYSSLSFAFHFIIVIRYESEGDSNKVTAIAGCKLGRTCQ